MLLILVGLRVPLVKLRKPTALLGYRQRPDEMLDVVMRGLDWRLYRIGIYDDLLRSHDWNRVRVECSIRLVCDPQILNLSTRSTSKQGAAVCERGQKGKMRKLGRTFVAKSSTICQMDVPRI